MTRKKIAKSSKYFQLGEKGRNEIIEMRSKGKTYSQILKYLNKEYQNMLEKGEDFKLTGLFFFFKNWGNEIVEKAQNKRKQQIIEKLSDSKKIEDIIDLISGWIDEYAADGKKLSLKDSISFFLKETKYY